MSGNDAFERSLKGALEAYEVPYNSTDWSLLEARMDQGRGGHQKQASWGLYALLFSGSMALASIAYVLVNQEDPVGSGPGTASLALLDQEEVGQVNTVAPSVAADPRPGMGTLGPNAGSDLGTEAATQPRRSAPAAKATAPVQRSAQLERPPVQGVPSDDAAGGAGTTQGVGGSNLIRASVTEGCPGTTVEFAMMNVPEDGIFLWNFGDGSFSNKPKPTHTFSKAGTYEVMLSHSSTNGGKFANKPVSDRIVIHEVPEAGFQFTKRDDENTIPTVHFENRSIGGRSFHWDFGDGHTSTLPHPTHVYKKQGNYTATLTVTNSNGCTDRTERTIRIDSDYDLLAAKAFSPNGDGVEDYFIPDALRTLGVKFHLSIFDERTGDLLYETSDPQRPWNGRIGNRGEPCSTGNYLWMVEMTDGEKLGGTYNGSVSLVR